MSKYIEIANILRKKIRDGKYKNDTLLPDQEELAKEFRTSRMTIQKSLKILSSERIIYSRQGSGTFVSRNANLIVNSDVGIEQYVGVTKLLGSNHVVESKILKFEMHYPGKEDQNTLSINNKEIIYDIARLRIVDKKPYALEYIKMPANVIPGITKEVLKKSIYNYIESDLNLKIGSAFRKISADKTNEFDQKYLNCKMDDPILEVFQTVFLSNGTPFEISRARHRYDNERVVDFVKAKLE